MPRLARGQFALSFHLTALYLAQPKNHLKFSTAVPTMLRKASSKASLTDESEKKYVQLDFSVASYSNAKRHKAYPKNPPVTLASDLSLEDIQHLLDFEYRPGLDKHRWDLPTNGWRRLHGSVGRYLS